MDALAEKKKGAGGRKCQDITLKVQTWRIEDTVGWIDSQECED